MATIEKLDASKVKLTIEVSAEDFEKAQNEAYLKTRRKYKIPGFREGHAPKRMIENAYGPLVFFDDAFELVYPPAYEAAVKEHCLEPVDRPEVTILACDPGNPVLFSADVVVRPEVTLGQYKGIEAPKQEYNVTDEMVDAEIDAQREKIARMVDMERPAEEGDYVNIDYSGSVDGVKFDGGTAEGQTLVIGSHMFIPGFEQQVIGMGVGEERDLTVTFPQEYHASELAGKEAVFHVKVNAIQKKELPAADDEFAGEVSEFDTIEALRQDKREKLLKRAEEDAKVQRENAIISKAVDNAAVEIPQVMVERQVDSMFNDLRYRLSMQGISIEDYCKYLNSTPDSLRTSMYVDASKRVKSQLVLDAIAKAEGIQARPEDTIAKLDEYALRFGDKADEFKASLSDNDMLYFQDQIIVDKTVALLVDTCVETEAEAKAD